MGEGTLCSLRGDRPAGKQPPAVQLSLSLQSPGWALLHPSLSPQTSSQRPCSSPASQPPYLSLCSLLSYTPILRLFSLPDSLLSLLDDLSLLSLFTLFLQAFLSPSRDQAEAHTCLVQGASCSRTPRNHSHTLSPPPAHHPHPDTPWTPMPGLTQILRPALEHACKDTQLPPGTLKIPTHRPQRWLCTLRVRGDVNQYGQWLAPQALRLSRQDIPAQCWLHMCARGIGAHVHMAPTHRDTRTVTNIHANTRTAPQLGLQDPLTPAAPTRAHNPVPTKLPRPPPSQPLLSPLRLP